jgi:hypothetical protein
MSSFPMTLIHSPLRERTEFCHGLDVSAAETVATPSETQGDVGTLGRELCKPLQAKDMHVSNCAQTA